MQAEGLCVDQTAIWPRAKVSASNNLGFSGCSRP